MYNLTDRISILLSRVFVKDIGIRRINGVVVTDRCRGSRRAAAEDTLKRSFNAFNSALFMLENVGIGLFYDSP
jgi:hypothetical protein